MNVVVEVSMYPLRNDYIAAIDEFLATLHSEGDVEVKTNRVSTQLFGEYDAVMDLLQLATRRAYEQSSTAVFVYKVIPGAGRTVNGYE
jgi:uncharacterized protein YqgV (UPF0045/DUF77 family)